MIVAKSKKALTQKEAEALGEQHVNRRDFADGLGPVIAGRDEAVSRAIKAEAQLSSMLILTKSIKRERDEAIKINGTLVAEKGELLERVAKLEAERDAALAEAEKMTEAATGCSERLTESVAECRELRSCTSGLLSENTRLKLELERVQPEFREIKALLHGLYDKIEGRNSSGA